MKNEVGRDENDELFVTITASDDAEEELLRLFIQGLRFRDGLCECLCTSDTDRVKALADKLDFSGMKEFKVGTDNETKSTVYLLNTLNKIHDKLKYQE